MFYVDGMAYIENKDLVLLDNFFRTKMKLQESVKKKITWTP